MNDTKFKIWCMDTKTWIKNEYGGYEFTMGDEHVGMPSYIYVQYIGQTDKNGTEIHKGHVVKAKFTKDMGQWDKELTPLIKEVKWIDSKAAFEPFFNYGTDYEYNVGPWEVIGNIFENPELLED